MGDRLGKFRVVFLCVCGAGGSGAGALAAVAAAAVFEPFGCGADGSRGRTVSLPSWSFSWPSKGPTLCFKPATEAGEVPSPFPEPSSLKLDDPTVNSTAQSHRH